MKESAVEKRLVDGLQGHGFKVYKLTTPGHTGTPDRLILRPTWSPGPPWVIELKRPKKHEERLQEIVRDQWRARGVLVLDMVDTYEKVDALVVALVSVCESRKSVCVNHASTVAVTNLDSEDLCASCADAWVRGEGASQVYDAS